MTATLESEQLPADLFAPGRVRSLEPRILGPDDWRELRRTRLWALRMSPIAFAHSRKREQKYSPKTWRRLLTESTWIEVRVVETGAPVGLACLRGESPDHEGIDPSSSVRYVEGVWIAPSERGSGAVDLVMEQAEKLALEQGIRKLLLWVFDGNVRAWNAYRRLGFEPTMDWRPEGNRIRTDYGWRVERRMGKRLS